MIHVATGSESRFLGVGMRRCGELIERVIWPRRKLPVRRRGEWVDTLAPIFPGAMFLQAEAIDTATYTQIKSLPGFLRFLNGNTKIVALGASDTALLRHFVSFGQVVGSSEARFDENDRIEVLSGPLMGMEGKIVKVDRRKGRARVRLELYNESFLIDFAFHALEGKQAPTSAGKPERQGTAGS